jgi:hypothetical protein
MLPFWKTLTFWISACSWLAVLGGHYSGVIPSPYGLVLGNVAVLVYALMRCLQKRQAGLAWKSILATSEFVGTALTMTANLLDSVSQIPSLPPKVLVVITGASGLIITILNRLAGNKSGIPVLPASEAVTFDEMPTNTNKSELKAPALETKTTRPETKE